MSPETVAPKPKPLSDIEIARAATPKPITEIARGLGIPEEHLVPYGRTKAKLDLGYCEKRLSAPKGKLVLVTAISPTTAGEGKTTTTVGLGDALNRIGKRAVICLREPSLGPCFGMKGGAAGGGRSQVIPMEDINLHFTGDFHAITAANNLLAALVDNHLQQGNALGIDPRRITWKRVLDVNDRALRDVVIGLGGTGNGVPRESGFDITAASEIMAVLALSSSLSDLRERLARITIGETYAKKRVTARDLKAEGALTALLKDALMPNLVQTLENNPALVHAGPFANIAHGCNSVMATQVGLRLGEYAITEAGFGADLGAEKFFDIKCRAAGLKPSAAVIVATVRALRYHGGVDVKEVNTAAPEKLKAGLANLGRHIENVAKFGVKAVVAINHFPTDTPEEIDLIKAYCKERGAEAVLAQGFAKGGDGMTDLASAVLRVIEEGKSAFKPLYDLNGSIKQKIETIAREIYRADGVDYSGDAETALRRIDKLGLNNVPICMAKTQYSFSDNKELRAAPTGFRITVRDIEISAGAGFVVPICGEIMRMPGLPEVPAAEGMDIDANGVISGLS